MSIYHLCVLLLGCGRLPDGKSQLQRSYGVESWFYAGSRRRSVHEATVWKAAATSPWSLKVKLPDGAPNSKNDRSISVL